MYPRWSKADQSSDITASSGMQMEPLLGTEVEMECNIKHLLQIKGNKKQKQMNQQKKQMEH